MSATYKHDIFPALVSSVQWKASPVPHRNSSSETTIMVQHQLTLHSETKGDAISSVLVDECKSPISITDIRYDGSAGGGPRRSLKTKVETPGRAAIHQQKDRNN